MAGSIPIANRNDVRRSHSAGSAGLITTALFPFPTSTAILMVILMTLKGEFGRMVGAEGATAPETLRLKDLEARNLWKAGGKLPHPR